jgi:pimeloyl-ACP methyl ester carboxylesterase
VAGGRYTYVVCHGATAGGWEWKKVDERLRADGHTMYRPTYTGLGERAHLANADVDLDTHITDVVNVILFEGLHDVVLVGHSYGGMVMTGVADRVPDRIKAMVYVDAMVPEDGESVSTAMGRRGGTTKPGGGSGAAATRPSSGMTSGRLGRPLREGARPPYNVTQPPKTFTQAIRLTNPGALEKIPVVYILTVDPGKRAEEDAFYFMSRRAKGRGWTVWEMESNHVPSVTHPAELTKLLEEAPGAAKATR